MLKKFKRLFFDYELIGPEKGFTISVNSNKIGFAKYYFSISDVKKATANHHLLYRFSPVKKVAFFDLYKTCNNEVVKDIKAHFRYMNNTPIYKFYRVKEKYCIVDTRYIHDLDVVLSSSTKIGNMLILFGVSISITILVWILYYILKISILFLFL